MNEVEITNEILRYINDKTYNYAVLIDGEWGSGKTYFVKNTLIKQIVENEEQKMDIKPRAVKYVSLYGCDSLSDVQENMAWAFEEDFCSIGKEHVDKEKTKTEIAGNLLTTSRKIGNIIAKKFVPEAKLYDLFWDWLRLKNYIFVIDDLERCSCQINELFGFINELVEHESTKVILVANEKEIIGIAEDENIEQQYELTLKDTIDWPEKEKSFYDHYPSIDKITISEMERRRGILFPNKEKNTAYLKSCEKLIGIKLHFTPDMFQAMEHILRTYSSNNSIEQYICNNLSEFARNMDFYNHHNLRTFLFFLSKVDYLGDALKSEDLDEAYRKRVVNHIVKETFIAALKFKANYKPIVTNKFFLETEKDTSSTIIKDYVELGNLNANQLSEYVISLQETFKENLEVTDPYNILYQEFYLHSQEACEQEIGKLIRNIKNNQYSVTIYPKIIISIQRLIDVGFDVKYMNQVKYAIIENIKNVDEVAPIDDDLFYLDNVFRKKVLAVIEEINYVILQQSTIKRKETIMEILSCDDWASRLQEYTNLSNKGLPIFAKAPAERWIKTISNADPYNIDLFRTWLNGVYSRKLRSQSYTEDAETIKAILAYFDVPDNDNKDLIMQLNIKWLIGQIKDIISVNEPDVNN